MTNEERVAEELAAVIKGADSAVALLEQQFKGRGLLQATSAAVALGRICEHYGIDINKAVVLATTISADHPKPAEVALPPVATHPPECPWHQDWHACNCGALERKPEGGA